MKKMVLLALSLLFIIGLTSCGNDKSDEQKTVNEATLLTLVSGGQTEYEIVYPEDAEGVELKFMKDIYDYYLFFLRRVIDGHNWRVAGIDKAVGKQLNTNDLVSQNWILFSLADVKLFMK